ncbi:MAG: ATP-binding cassette domain-containing protein [Candidatus Bathyarchaeia archaeon]|jgi:ABC-2 type transport system ATP-binding protein
MNPVDVQSLSKTFETKEGPILRKTRRSLTAVDGISFSVPKGEIFALLGPNGAGKTTTVKMLCTLITPSLGDAIINGFSVVKEQQKVRESLGVMLTGERTLYWKLTGHENLQYFAALYHLQPSDSKERIEQLLKLVGLAEREDTLVENYSTGMRIRLSFAKALLNEAPVLLFDEPTASLDPQSSHLIRDLIRDLKREGRSIILTTHNMDEAEVLSDRVAIIDHGKIVQLGTPAELKQKVKTSEVIEIEARNISKQAVDAIQALSGISKVAFSDVNGEKPVLRIHAERGKEILPRILELLVREKTAITNVSVIEPTLEDVFIEETGRSLRD